MVRTKADSAGVKVLGAKAPRKALTATPTRSSYSDSDSKNKPGSSGGNSYHPRETPEWQKPITNFFITPSSSHESMGGSGTSKVTSGSSSSTTEVTQ